MKLCVPAKLTIIRAIAASRQNWQGWLMRRVATVWMLQIGFLQAEQGLVIMALMATSNVLLIVIGQKLLATELSKFTIQMTGW